MNTTFSPINRESIFPLPFTREQIKEDVCNILLFEARKSAHLYGASLTQPPKFLDGKDFSVWFDLDRGPKEIGINFEMVSNCDLAMAMEDYFDYAFYAVSFHRVEAMDYESIHTWLGYYLLDSSTSFYSAEWESYGATILESVKRCLYLCELANARRLLEGNEAFCYFNAAGKDETSSERELSIRYLAMLAGMEELSLRSAISRKTVPILEIKKDDRRTYVESDVAKAWLIAKGRYQPVVMGRLSSEIDLTKMRFNSIDDFGNMLDQQLAIVDEKSSDRAALQASLDSVLRANKVQDLRKLNFDDLCNDAFIDAIATLMDLSPDLLKIRAKEAALKSRIYSCEMELKQLHQS